MNKFRMAMALLKVWVLLMGAATAVILEELLWLMMCKECPDIQEKSWDEWMERHEHLWTK